MTLVTADDADDADDELFDLALVTADDADDELFGLALFTGDDADGATCSTIPHLLRPISVSSSASDVINNRLVTCSTIE